MKAILISVLFAAAARAKIGDICQDSSGNSGTCEEVSFCQQQSGTIKTALCPSDPSDVSCCFKPQCQNLSNSTSGFCDVTGNSCSLGTYVTGHCPGPTNYQCCLDTNPAPTPSLSRPASPPKSFDSSASAEASSSADSSAITTSSSSSTTSTTTLTSTVTVTPGPSTSSTANVTTPVTTAAATALGGSFGIALFAQVAVFALAWV